MLTCKILYISDQIKKDQPQLKLDQDFFSEKKKRKKSDEYQSPFFILERFL